MVILSLVSSKYHGFLVDGYVDLGLRDSRCCC